MTGSAEKITQATTATKSETTGSTEKITQTTAARKTKTTGSTGKITPATATRKTKTTGSTEKITKPPLTERLRLQAVQKRSWQVGKEDVLASKPLPEGSKKSPTLQEKSKQSTVYGGD